MAIAYSNTHIFNGNSLFQHTHKLMTWLKTRSVCPTADFINDIDGMFFSETHVFLNTGCWFTIVLASRWE